MSPNILLTLDFDGTNYAGWQIQKNAIALEEIIENALGKIYGQPITVYSCSRTDSGVHAKNFVINFIAPPTANKIPIAKIPLALNAILPFDIVVKKSKKVKKNFHATFDAKQKTYRYTILNQPFRNVFLKNFYHHIKEPLDVAAIQKAAKLFIGSHDFSAFCIGYKYEKNCVRKIFKIKITKKKNFIFMDFTGNGFLHNMVRIMAGTLVEVGKGRYSLRDLRKALTSKNRSHAGPTLPACGLCLEKVVY